jgi:cell division protein FtsN
MTDHDRGAYTPQTDAPLAFDARVSHGGRRSHAPVTLIVSAVVLIGLVAAMVMFYRSGVRGSGQPPQVVGAPVGETKAPPPASTQSASAATALQIYKSEATPAGEPKDTPAFVPPPEETATRPAPIPAAVVAQPLAAVARLRTAQAPSSEAADNQAPPAPPPSKPIVEKPVKIAEPKVSPAKAALAASGDTTGLRNLVQIGAFSSPAIADKGWSDVAALIPGQMAGKTRKVEPTTKDGKLFYRTFVGGFTSKDDADAFCASLKAAGKSCFVK